MLHLPPNLQVTGSWSRKCTVWGKQMRMRGPCCQAWARASCWALIVRDTLNVVSKLIIRGQSNCAPVTWSSSNVPIRSPEAHTSIHFPVAKYLTLGWMGKHPQIQSAYVVPEILGKLKMAKWIRQSDAGIVLDEKQSRNKQSLSVCYGLRRRTDRQWWGPSSHSLQSSS